MRCTTRWTKAERTRLGHEHPAYAANDASPVHQRCRELLASWRSSTSAWYTTWSVLYEFLRVSTHPRVFASPLDAPRAWSFVEALLASPSLDVLVETERHASVMKEVIDELPDLAGNILHDAHTAILMREHGLRRIVTRDTDFHRFPFLEVVDPLRD